VVLGTRNQLTACQNNPRQQVGSARFSFDFIP